jgi:DNA (cytosine-5)-methyltransferase 1
VTAYRNAHQIGLRFSKSINVVAFAGFGGTCLGMQIATGRSPEIAINHWRDAIENHAVNHPETYHYCEDVFAVSPTEACAGRKVDAFWMSPDCTSHSRAKGSAPRDNKRRGLAMVGIDWAREVRPRVIFLENVAEFLKWGPLDERGQPIKEREGESFEEFVGELRALGYVVEWRTLVACDYGAPTSRKRLFLIARCDGAPIVWPEPTHGPGRLPYRTAAECIDWSIPVPSIFDRPKPHVAATCRRIAEGMRRFVLGEQKPFLAQVGYGERPGQKPRVMSLDEPLTTVVASGVKHALVCAFVAKHFGGGPNGKSPPGLSMRSPLGAITTVDHHALVTAHVDGAADSGERVRRFFAEHGLGDPSVMVRGERLRIVDIGMRRLVSRELARGQGFPDSYILTGNETAATAKVGNAVPPPVAAALVAANLGTEIARAA